MKWFVLVLSVAVVVGCGKGAGTPPPAGPEPVTQQGEWGVCPLNFTAQGRCAEGAWTVGPSADAKSSWVVKFWERGSSAEGTLSDPQGEVTAWFRMTCCGSVKAAQVAQPSAGTFEISSTELMPGSWELHIRVKQGENVGTQVVPFEVGF